jgi:hypothetical protein
MVKQINMSYCNFTLFSLNSYNIDYHLLLMIIYKCTNNYNHLQTHLHVIKTNLQASKLLNTHMYRHTFIKNAKLIKACVYKPYCKISCVNAS